MTKGLLIGFLALASSFASAKTMSCLVGVYRAQDMNEDAQVETTTSLARVPISGYEGDLELKVNGETVAVTLVRKQHTDLFDYSVVLMTPVGDRIPKTSYVTALQDYLVNEGPAKDNGWTVDYKPGAVRYEFLQRRSGTLMLTPKLRDALKEDGKWGEYPFTSSAMDPMHGALVGEAIQELLKKKKLKKSDVVAISSLFSCTLNK